MEGTYHDAPCLECAKLRAELAAARASDEKNQDRVERLFDANAKLRALAATDRRTIDRLSSLAYPDGLSGDAGMSCNRYMELQRNLSAADAERAKLVAELAKLRALLKAKDALLVAYRIGKRPPEWALDLCAKEAGRGEGKK